MTVPPEHAIAAPVALLPPAVFAYTSAIIVASVDTVVSTELLSALGLLSLAQ